MEYLILIVGFACLIKGADFFVDGAASVAYKFKISTTIVGLTIVALGTSLPEAAVSISASLAGSNSLAISNVIGSNIFNTLVVVGCSALIAPFLIPKEVVKRDLPINIFATLLLSVMLVGGLLMRLEGLVLVVCLAAYIVILIRDARKNPLEEDAAEEKKILPGWTSALCIVGGAAMIILGGQLTVSGAKTIAADLGMSETLIGLTVVSIGTSLPELVTSVVAARKGESGLSIGNAIGSNIMNIFFILGASSLIHPLASSTENLMDAIILCCIAIGIYVMARLSRKMDRPKACLFLAVYAGYMAYIILR